VSFLEFCGTSRMVVASVDFLIPWGCLKENKWFQLRRWLCKNIGKPLLRPWAILVVRIDGLNKRGGG